jgi:hypothetical protein
VGLHRTGETNSRVPISRLVSPSRTSAAILTSVAVRAPPAMTRVTMRLPGASADAQRARSRERTVLVGDGCDSLISGQGQYA